jgi:hypothetical protein
MDSLAKNPFLKFFPDRILDDEIDFAAYNTG